MLSQYKNEKSGPNLSGYFFSGLFWTSGLSPWASDLFHLHVVTQCLVSKKLLSSTGIANSFSKFYVSHCGRCGECFAQTSMKNFSFTLFLQGQTLLTCNCKNCFFNLNDCIILTNTNINTLWVAIKWNIFFWKVHFLPFQKRYSFLCCSKNLLGYDFFLWTRWI